MSRHSYVVESSLGEKRTAKAERERVRLVEHFAALHKHVRILSAQVTALGGTPLTMAACDAEEVIDAEAYLEADLDERPVTDDDIAQQKRARGSRTLAEIQRSSTAARIEAFLRGRGGEHSILDLSKALNVTRAAVTMALCKARGGLFHKRSAGPTARPGVRVLYRLATEADEAEAG